MKDIFEQKHFYDTVTVGARGQIVIPARARKEFAIKPGDKLLVIKGLAHGSLVLLHAKSMTSVFSKLLKHVDRVRKILLK